MATSQQIVDDVARGIKILGAIASAEQKVEPYAVFISSFVPGLGSAVAAVALAQPYIDKVAQYAPQVAAIVQNEGVPVVDAMRSVAPEIIGHVKTAVAMLQRSDPTLSHVTVADIADVVAAQAFAGFFGDVFKNSEFSPQDPRFDRASAGNA
ncbi:MAG TPA: hypothetical protein VIU44_15900 [Gaiellaceae bacterium]